MGVRKQIPMIVFLGEDNVPGVMSLSFSEKLNRIFHLIGFDNAGDWAGRPLHGELSCQHSAAHAKVPRGTETRKRSTRLSCRAWLPMEHPVTDGETVERIPLQIESQDDAEAGVGAFGGSERAYSQDEWWHGHQSPLSQAYRGLQRWSHNRADAADRRSRGHGDDGPEAVNGERNTRGRTAYSGGAQRDSSGSANGSCGQRLGSAATAPRVVTVVDGPFGPDKRAGAILGLIATLVLACCNGERPDDHEDFTHSGSETTLRIDVRHCDPKRSLDSEKIWITIDRFVDGQLDPVSNENEHKVKDGMVKVVLEKSGSYYRVQARHDEYGSTYAVAVLGGRSNMQVKLCFSKFKSLKSKDYTFLKWSELKGDEGDEDNEFTGLKRVISGHFENLRLRSRRWNWKRPKPSKKISKLGLLPAEKSEITNVYDYDYTTCEKESGEKKKACHTLVNAKAGLLNLYAALRTSGPYGDSSKRCDPNNSGSWWEYIKEIKMIQPDRIVATVREDMACEITMIRESSSSQQNNSTWESGRNGWVNRGFDELFYDERKLNEVFSDTEPAGLRNICLCKESSDDKGNGDVAKYRGAIGKYHRHNFKAAIGRVDGIGDPYDPILSIKSIKSTERIASLQLTIARIENRVAPYYLLDADIDEHTGYRHIKDWFRHRIFGVGTNPFQIGEMLTNRCKDRHCKDIELGYRRNPHD